MKKIVLLFIVLVQTTLFAQNTQTIEKPLKLSSVSKGTANDSILLLSASKLVKYLPVSELKAVTNLDYLANPNGGTVFSSTGNDAVLPLATNTNSGLFSSDEKIKLASLKTTIANIRALSGTLSGTLNNTTFYTVDLGKEGNWYYDSTDTTSADNTGTVLVTSDGKRIKRVISEKINLSWFGVVGDGVAIDVVGVLSALRISELLKKPLYVTKGIYKISTWTTQEFSYVNIIGANKFDCIFVGPLDNYSRIPFISLGTNSELINKGISIQGFDRTYYSNKHVASVTISDCFFKNNRYAIYHADGVSVYPNSIIDYVSVYDNVIDTSAGFQMRCGFLNGATFTNNKFTNVTRNPSYYPMIVGQGVPLYAIGIGDGDDLSPTLGQDLSNRLIVSGNTVNGMYNPTYRESGGWYTTNPIAVYGRQAVISNNVISNVTTNGVTDCEGIYTKVVEGIISNNIVTNCGTIDVASGAIAIKGVADLDISGNPVLKPKSKYIKVFGNIIVNDPVNYPSYAGVFTFGGQNIEIYDNVIKNQGASGQSGTGIALQSSSSLTGVEEINVHDNIISNIYGENAIVATPNFVKKLDIKNNTIYNIFGKNSSTISIGIRVRATTTVLDYLDISGNKYFQDVLDPSSVLGFKFIEILPTTTGSYIKIENNDFNISTNNFTTASLVVGISVAKGTGDISNLKINRNTFSGDVGVAKFRPFTFNSSTALWSQTWLPNLVFEQNLLNNSILDYLYKNISISDADYTMGRAESFIDLPVNTANRIITLPTSNITNREIIIRNKNTSAFNWAFPANSSVRNGRNIGVTNIPNNSTTTLFFDGINWGIKSVIMDYVSAVTDSRPYKVYTGIISQSSTSAPTITVNENNTGITIAWARNSAGSYAGTISSGTFPVGKTVCFISGGAQVGIVSTYNVNTTTINIMSANNVGTFSDGIISACSLEIRIYN